MKKKNKANFIVRKNHFSYEDGEYHIGKATQVITICNDFVTAKKTMLKYAMDSINSMCSENYLPSGNENYPRTWNKIYKAMMMKGYIFNLSSLDSIKTYGEIWELAEKYIEINTIEEMEIVNYFYPINTIEIVATSKDYLLMPKYNLNYFELTNIEIPKMNFDDYIISNFHLDKGFYVDEFDYFENVSVGCNSFGLLRNIFSYIDVNNHYLVDTQKIKEFINKQPSIYKIENNFIKVIPKDNFMAYYFLNKELKVKPIIFDTIKFSEYKEIQKNIYLPILKRLIEENDINDRVMFDEYYGNFETLSLTKEFGEELLDEIFL